MQRSSSTSRRRPGASAQASALESWPEPILQTGATEDPAETARYIAQLTGELAAIAGAAKLETLAYLLAMAKVEAEVAARS